MSPNYLGFAEDGGSSKMKCPSCGYAADSARFAIDGGASGTSDSSSESLRAPQGAPNGSGTVPLTVRGASSGNMGLANSGGRAIGLARRFPVVQGSDMIVSRQPDGTAIVRHRSGGNEVGKIRQTARGWVPTVDDKDSDTPHRHQRGALIEMVGRYNKSVAGAPLQAPAQQTPLMQQFGVPAIRLAYDPDDDGDDDSTPSGDTDKDGPGGLSPKGQGIYKKLIAKGMSPKVALAMAKRAQNFGAKAS